MPPSVETTRVLTGVEEPTSGTVLNDANTLRAGDPSAPTMSTPTAPGADTCGLPGGS